MLQGRDHGVVCLPHAGAVGQKFLLMDDNAMAHRACIVMAYLEDIGMARKVSRYESDRARTGHAAETHFCLSASTIPKARAC